MRHAMDHGHGPHRGRRHGPPGWDDEGPGGFKRGPRGRRRMFDAGELRHTLLLLMEGGERHGYDLIREIEGLTGGAYAPSPGTIYPTLTLLEELGHVEARASEGSRRLFAITPDGTAHLSAHRAEAEAALERLRALAVGEGPSAADPVWRAMQNLKTVLGQRMAGQADKAFGFAVADIIDEAARKIERL
ncbi:DNA-binding PadR family transcriptional regulator [Methylorubrum rhodinum]|uniref:DNA-binding PadR family transcriptional regulator n=1 Tax=Methylorubrum rhodinum TaxID=29428 RepID=A0A840ZI96_9HYPH|nr:PadR family transcriptional regulator [Methylorubrum rhodinum]MBB5757752.1 DNA-binding PadR family transcriptional regulator [Methylorubrum rhodinum]